MFHQLLTPVAGSLPLSFLVAALPVAVVLVLLGVVRRPAWEASLAGLVVGFVIAIAIWDLPTNLAVNSIFNGVVFALWPVMWIVFNALLLYNVAVESGRFDAFREWVLHHLPDDRRVVLVVIGFCFGALGAPVTVLGAVTSLPPSVLGAMIGRQLPFIAVILPFYVMTMYGGLRSVRALWPVLLVAGGSFGISQFIASNHIDYSLTDVLSSLGSLIVTLLFLQVWKPAPDQEFAVREMASETHVESHVSPWQGWLPWIIVTVVVIIWTSFGIASIGQQAVHWPGLDKAIAITLYDNKPYAAVWTFQPLATGTAILVAVIITALVVRMSLPSFFTCVGHTFRQSWLAIVTVCIIVGLAYLMNYSGLAYTLGLGAASVGHLFIFVSPFLGWVAVFLSGSDTSGNALFGNLQVVAARQLNLNPVLFAAANSSGGVMGKMISPQNIATGVAVTKLRGKEGEVFARTFWHSIIFTLMVGVLVAIQQFIVPGMIPAH